MRGPFVVSIAASVFVNVLVVALMALWVITLRVGFVCASRARQRGPMARALCTPRAFGNYPAEERAVALLLKGCFAS